MSNYPTHVYLNGKILDYKNAKISVFDRGFLFGDGIYEVMVQIDESFFYGEAHLARLSDCLDKINIDFNVNDLPDKIKSLLKECELEGKDCLLYIQVTRGIAPRKHAFPKTIEPTLMMYAIPFMLPAINKNHYAVILLEDKRWHRCDIKTTSLLGNIMANTNAVNQDCYEALMIRNGKITEASHCNVFFVKNDIVYTHPANEDILNGITRQQVIQLCKDLNIKIKEEAVEKESIINMDEAFLTGTSTQIASIQNIDDHYFYKNQNTGAITERLQKAFLELKSTSKKAFI